MLHGYAFDPVLQNFHVQVTLKGLKRLLCAPAYRSLPITLDILLAISHRLNLRRKLHKTIWAAFLTGYFASLRKSNLVPFSVKDLNNNHYLRRNSFVFLEDCVIVKLHWTKTLQSLRSPVEIPLPKISNSVLCPYTALTNMIQHIPADANMPAFLIPHNGTLLTLTHKSFVSFLRKFLSECSISPDLYTGHSFRKGLPQLSNKIQDINLSQISTFGTWSSNSVHCYLGPDYQLKTRTSVMHSVRNYISMHKKYVL